MKYDTFLAFHVFCFCMLLVVVVCLSVTYIIPALSERIHETPQQNYIGIFGIYYISYGKEYSANNSNCEAN